MTTKQKQEEIDNIINQANEHINHGSSPFFGLSYEDGIIAMYEWLFMDGENPLEQ